MSHSRSSKPPGLLLQSSHDGAAWTPPWPCPACARATSRWRPSPSRRAACWPWRGSRRRPGTPFRLTTRRGPREHAWDLYVTASANGAPTFAAPVSVSKSPSRTDPKLARWPYGTDYISLAAASDGSFHLLWVDTRDSKGEVQTAKIDVRV